MSDPDRPGKLSHFPLAKHVAHEAIGLVQMNLITVQSRNARRVLAPVLEDGQAVVNFRRDWPISDNAYDSAHFRMPFPI